MTAPLFSLEGQVAIITGATRGIGKAIALRMAEHGARIVVSSRKAEACEAVVAEIRDAGGEAVARPCNITDTDGLDGLVDAALSTWGRIDTLVCNAAVNPYYGPSAEMPMELFDMVMNANVRSNVILVNKCAPHMQRQGGGAVIIISSVGGLQGNDKLGAYALSKAADMQLARNVAVEWGPHNIRANCIAPGLIQTHFAKAIWSDPQIHENACQSTPLRRIGQPDEIAGAAVFLASASGSFTTGQTLVIDGGRLIGGRVAS